MPEHPLLEVFGFPTDNHSAEAVRARQNRLCPFGNRVPNCTKDRAADPLGVCSIRHKDGSAIVCPIRFREDWIIAEDAAEFFFGPTANWTTLTEVRLNDASGKSAGNIDVVLCEYDDRGEIVDFGALEVQAVYISGNIRSPFRHYMEDPPNRDSMDWREEKHYPRADFLSSSRKRLAPQLIFKGGILNRWGKKCAVAIDESFFATIPQMPVVEPSESDLAWFVYGLDQDPVTDCLRLTRRRVVYTKFAVSLKQVTRSEAGAIDQFVKVLQRKLNDKLDDHDEQDSTATITAPS